MGCYIANAFYTPSTTDPANPCESCQPLTAPLAWTVYTCDQGNGTCSTDSSGAPGCLSSSDNLGDGDCAGLAVNATSAYWAVPGVTGTSHGAIETDSLPIVEASSLVTPQLPFGVALDSTFVYWTDQLTGDTMRVPLDGGDVVTLSAANTPPYAIAVDSNYVYVTTYGAGSVAGVAFFLLDGGGYTTLVSETGGPDDLAVEDGFIYWTNQALGTVSRIQLDGGGLTPIASGQNHPTGLAVNQTSVYWANSGDATLMQAPLGGGFFTTIATTARGAVALDSNYVYWISGTGVTKALLDGGSPITLPSGRTGSAGSGYPMFGLAVENGNVFWEDGVGVSEFSPL